MGTVMGGAGDGGGVSGGKEGSSVRATGGSGGSDCQTVRAGGRECCQAVGCWVGCCKSCEARGPAGRAGRGMGGEQVGRLSFRKAGAGEELLSGAKAGRTHLGGV